MAKEQRTPVSKFGEDGLIRHLLKDFPPSLPDVITSVGDDAAVLHTGHESRRLIVTTDLLVEGIHFDLTYVPLQHLGYKTVAVNVSDIYAMNARPAAITLSIAFSNRFPAEALEALYFGVRKACEHYSIDLIGGDTSSSRSGLFLNVTALGYATDSELVYRSGAREDDVLCVTGNLGAAYAGLQILEREKAVFADNPNLQPDLQQHAYVVERQLKPDARSDLYDVLQQKGLRPTAMMDLSDGLATDLNRLCEASGVGAAVYQEHLPIDPRTAAVAKLFDQPATTYALYGGEDYELLFTLPPQDYKAIEDYPEVTAIGQILPRQRGLQFVGEDGGISELQPLGHDHFLDDGTEAEGQ